MTGGNDHKEIQVKSVKHYDADGFHIEDLPPLRTNKIGHGHCVVALDGYQLFVTGKGSLIAIIVVPLTDASLC